MNTKNAKASRIPVANDVVFTMRYPKINLAPAVKAYKPVPHATSTEPA
jgi:hypothetical protein